MQQRPAMLVAIVTCRQARDWMPNVEQQDLGLLDGTASITPSTAATACQPSAALTVQHPGGSPSAAGQPAR